MRGYCSTLITTTRGYGDSHVSHSHRPVPCRQQFDQITRAVTLCHKNLRESDQILFRFRLLNRLLVLLPNIVQLLVVNVCEGR